MNNFPIKYRGRRVDSGDYFFGFYARVSRTYNEEDGYVDLIIDDFGVEFEVYPDSVDMFTGLYDSYGNEFYTGDTIDYYTRNYNETFNKVELRVLFDNGQFTFKGLFEYDYSFVKELIETTEARKERCLKTNVDDEKYWNVKVSKN